MLTTLFANSKLTPITVNYFFIFITPFLILRKFLKHDHQGHPTEGKIDFNIPKFANSFLYYLTKLENSFFNYIPNLFGGSLFAIAQK